MGINIFDRMVLKILEYSISREKNPLVDKDLFLRVTRMAMEPMGEPKVPLYRTRHDKKNAFKVINGGLNEKRND
ncbi:hypothetical protein D1B31_02060 [Neobacillus notoginsengisoli]|uniref:Uncharacterized protein n=1 Tax=Neobacillus notoginsengisoli TaxID=1578198 RepID=A0A417Z006_9BACI|nr:hypothetical protein [Neobacillus notoginsengisoli]RHW43467.1 hypothetical protein D1B31_02060 [Neobacillus notoginsengisoli]